MGGDRIDDIEQGLCEPHSSDLTEGTDHLGGDRIDDIEQGLCEPHSSDLTYDSIMEFYERGDSIKVGNIKWATENVGVRLGAVG